jgi:hypothetical protein
MRLEGVREERVPAEVFQGQPKLLWQWGTESARMGAR